MQSFKEVYEKYRGKRSDAAVAKKANLHKSTFSRIKNELIPPKRNYLWSLAMSLELTLDEADELFSSCGLCMASQYHLTDMQRVQYKNHKLSEEKIKKLEKIGFDFEVSENQWMRNYEAYKQYIETLNEKNVIEYDAVEVNRLKTWINSQKAQDKKLKLSSKRKKMLEDIGVDFTYKW